MKKAHKHSFRDSIATIMMLLSLCVILLHAVVPHHHHHHVDESLCFCIHEDNVEKHSHGDENGDATHCCSLQKLLSLLVISTKDDELLCDNAIAVAHLYSSLKYLNVYFLFVWQVPSLCDVSIEPLCVAINKHSYYEAMPISLGVVNAVWRRGPPVV